MLKIWGRISSINVKKVVWTAQELGLDFQRTEAGGLFGIVKTPDFIALNPNSLVPVIEDGDYTLWESNVVVRYLCAKHAPDTLYPQSLRERFSAERWMDWQQTTFNPASRPGFWQLVRTPAEQRNLELIAGSNAAVETSRWPARRTAGSLCRRRARAARMSSAGLRVCARARPAPVCWILRCHEPLHARDDFCSFFV